MAFTAEVQQKIQQVVTLLKSAKKLFFVTGAGISADSGLPTYRGLGGLYNDTETEEGLPIETVLSGEMMQERPHVTWRYLSEIEEACRGATFNRAHSVIAEMEQHFERVCVFTQNVDGFHRWAGSANVIDIHGDLHNLMCPKCTYRHTVENYADLKIPPPCPQCNTVLRPDVVLFGEWLDADKLGRLEYELDQDLDVLFSIGTSSLFPYISKPVLIAEMRGIPTVEINPEVTDISEVVTYHLPTRAVEAMEAIWKGVRDR